MTDIPIAIESSQLLHNNNNNTSTHQHHQINHHKSQQLKQSSPNKNQTPLHHLHKPFLIWKSKRME